MPQIRYRPQYPRLRDGSHAEVADRGGKCSKYYSQYSQRRLTGGIMCAWCTHSICYGFHCIPRGEGRNDVFSAMITRWPRAPKRVIYDFACALGPYCLTREPAFFADTLFVVDDFHAKGHAKCSAASFLKTYAAIDPRLIRINSSAAECGNGGMWKRGNSTDSKVSQLHDSGSSYSVYESLYFYLESVDNSAHVGYAMNKINFVYIKVVNYICTICHKYR